MRQYQYLEIVWNRIYLITLERNILRGLLMKMVLKNDSTHQSDTKLSKIFSYRLSKVD